MKKRILLTSLLSFFGSIAFGQTAEELSSATDAFLKTLNNDQLATTSIAFEDTRRTKWTNLPVGISGRPGIRFGDLSDESKIEFHKILTTLFSSQGYLKTTSIMQLDDILNVLYQTAFDRGEIDEAALNRIKNLEWDFGNYYVTVWGTPKTEDPWGLKFGGHHLSINLTVTGDEYAVTPLFLGSDPSEVSTSKYAGLRVLSKEEDYGFRLINALDETQKKTATLSQDVPGDILTNPNSPQRIDDYYGLKASEMTESQKQILQMLIEEFVNNLEHDKAHEALDQIAASGINNIYFAWIGSYKSHAPHYYIINGPDFLIEYDNVGFQNDGNHIHAIWREKGNDFGEDILKAHYDQHQH